MPVQIRKKKGRKCYQVTTPNSIKARCTSLKKAKKQERLLHGIESGWQPTRSRKRGM